MPEHDTFDLDAAFDALERDIAGLSRGPGAARAVSTARRRRRTRIGAVAAAAVVAIGGIVLVQSGGSHDTSIQPAATLPPPAPIDAAAMTQSTQGWTTPWHVLTPENSSSSDMLAALTPSCRSVMPHTGVRSTGSGDTRFGTADGRFAWALSTRYATHRDASADEAAYRTGFDTCPGGQVTDIAYPGGNSATFFLLPSPQGGTVAMTLVLRDNTTMILEIGPAEGITPESEQRLADTAMAALALDSTFTSDVPNGGPEPTTPQDHANLDLGRLQRAFGDWQSGTSGSTTSRLPRPEPCGSSAWSRGGKTLDLGPDAVFWVHQFGSTAEAQAGYQEMQDALAQCPGSATRTVTSPGGSEVFVARGQDDAWVVRHDDWVVAAYVPRGDTPPPDPVSTAVGAALVGVVDDALAAHQSSQH